MTVSIPIILKSIFSELRRKSVSYNDDFLHSLNLGIFDVFFPRPKPLCFHENSGPQKDDIGQCLKEK